MFPGKLKTVIYYADTGVRRGGTCAPQEVMLQELRGLLGEKNVVLKITLILQFGYTFVTKRDTMICELGTAERRDACEAEKYWARRRPDGCCSRWC